MRLRFPLYPFRVDPGEEITTITIAPDAPLSLVMEEAALMARKEDRPDRVHLVCGTAAQAAAFVFSFQPAMLAVNGGTVKEGLR